MPLSLQALFIFSLCQSASPFVPHSLWLISSTPLFTPTARVKCTLSTQHTSVVTAPNPAQLLRQLLFIRLPCSPGCTTRSMPLSVQTLFFCFLRPSCSPSNPFTMRPTSSTPSLPLATHFKRAFITKHAAVATFFHFSLSPCSSFRLLYSAFPLRSAASLSRHQRAHSLRSTSSAPLP